ncbi:thiaminase II [Moraxella sp. Pampa]|uniref:thiaminase II n=1 Tax=Moraxella sp. Pampa TaxID=3111978 RepID=UPI002B400E44|nr:thiaminase II [Moraxella sp. Pampa]
MQTFSQILWQENLPLYKATLNLPFNQELAAGTLSKEAFSHYVIQDAHYLLAYGRALSVCAAKAYQADEVILFSEAAKEAIVVERSLHDGFMQDFGISREDFLNTPLTLACHHYTSYLIACAYADSYPVVLASLLPCFWIYAKVGQDIYEKSVPNNPYQAWIDTYAGAEFHTAVQKVIDVIDKVAKRTDQDTLNKMRQAYTDAAKLEWLFWESAYHQTKWRGLDELS